MYHDWRVSSSRIHKYNYRTTILRPNLAPNFALKVSLGLIGCCQYSKASHLTFSRSKKGSGMLIERSYQHFPCQSVPFSAFLTFSSPLPAFFQLLLSIAPLLLLPQSSSTHTIENSWHRHKVRYDRMLVNFCGNHIRCKTRKEQLEEIFM
jgi:hypothetical protein